MLDFVRGEGRFDGVVGGGLGVRGFWYGVMYSISSLVIWDMHACCAASVALL